MILMPYAFAIPGIFTSRQYSRSRKTHCKTVQICSVNPLTQSNHLMRPIEHLRDIISSYDAIFLDQFGVIHDGKTPYSHALDAISQIHAAGIKIIILSNSSRLSEHAASRLEALGIPLACIHGIITSGQIALGRIRKLMEDKPDTRVLHLTWTSSRGRVSLADHNVKVLTEASVNDDRVVLPRPEDADIVLAHGTEGISQQNGGSLPVPIGDLRQLCQRIGRERPNMPFYCANPDVITVEGPALRQMPGTFANDYENAGGSNVFRLGKPEPVAYEEAFELIPGIKANRVLAIGDSIGHDILGASRAGIDSLYIAGGINANMFGIDPSDGFRQEVCSWSWDEQTFNDIAREDAPALGDSRPTYVSSFFRW